MTDESNFENFLIRYIGNDDNSNDNENNLLDESLSKLITKCKYYDLDDMSKLSTGQKFNYTALHINIHSLPSKHDELLTLLSNLLDKGIEINFIMLCETFLNDANKDMYSIPGYQFIQKNR